jgi:hypothetical protein
MDGYREISQGKEIRDQCQPTSAGIILAERTNSIWEKQEIQRKMGCGEGSGSDPNNEIEKIMSF